MPYSSNGNYALPPGYKAETGQKVLPTQHNPPLEDIAAALSSVLLRSGVAPMEGDLPMGGNRIVDLGAGVLPADAATLGQLSNSMPIGAILDFAGSTAPSGWLMCFGQEVSRTEYEALFSATGTTYGAGNGSTTFNIPDLRGRVIAGKDNMGGTAAERITTDGSGVDGKTLGAAGGAQAHTLTIEQMPEHKHQGDTSEDGDHTHKYELSQAYDQSGSNRNWFGWGQPGSAFNAEGKIFSAGKHKHTLNMQASGGGLPHSSMQPTVVMNKIIRALVA